MPPLPATLADIVGERRWVRVDDGQSGAVVHRLVGGQADLFLKCGEGALADAVFGEAARLRWLAGRVPAARVLAAEALEGTAWMLTEALPGRSAGAWLSRYLDRTGELVGAVAGYMLALHGLPVDECPFDSSVAAWLPEARQRVASRLVDEDDFDSDHLGWSAARVLAEVESLAECATDRVVVHGDFSLGNLLIDDDGTVSGCIDAGRLGVADPYQDIAICWRDLGGFGAATQAMFLDALRLDPPDWQRITLHRSLDELF